MIVFHHAQQRRPQWRVRPWRSWRCLGIWGVCVGLVSCTPPPPVVPLPPVIPPPVVTPPPVLLPPHGTRTVGDVLAFYGPGADQRLWPYVQAAGVAYPPQALTLVGFKEEKRLEVWGQQQGIWVLLRTYPVLAASGVEGPKLREGDEQVPEGLYRIEALNPNSQFHLSMKVDYPNAYDRQQAAQEGRRKLGGDIFIHGHEVSTGCLAMGDPVIEELFVLVARVGIERVSVLLVPYDLRRPASGRPEPRQLWVRALYAELRRALEVFPVSRLAF